MEVRKDNARFSATEKMQTGWVTSLCKLSGKRGRLEGVLMGEGMRREEVEGKK